VLCGDCEVILEHLGPRDPARSRSPPPTRGRPRGRQTYGTARWGLATGALAAPTARRAWTTRSSPGPWSSPPGSPRTAAARCRGWSSSTSASSW